MSNLLEVNTEEAGKKLAVVRRYHSELLIILFGAAIVFLFTKVDKIETEMRTYLNEDRKAAITILNANTHVLEDNNNELKDIKDLLQESNEMKALKLIQKENKK